MNEVVVSVKEVTVRLNGLVVLDRVSLTINKGEFAAIIGPNGAGKTTLLRVIVGLLRPDSGSAEVMGRPVDQLGDLRSKIGYVPQTYAIDPNFPITVFEAVLMGTYGRVGIGRRPRPQERAAAMAALGKVGMADLADRPIRRLSGGQRQRLFIARALANDPELLLLDEPATGVDVATTGSLYSLLRELRSGGVTVLLVSHDVGVVATYIDTLACLNRSMVAHCRPDEVECSEALKAMYGCDVAYLHHGDSPHIVVEDH
mgnify:CR=1 FL=1